MSNFFAAFASECGRLFRKSSLRGLLVTLVVLASFGVLVPWMKGFEFLDTRFVLAYCSIGLLFAGPLMAEMLATDGSSKPAPIVNIARIALVALYGWTVSSIMLLIGFAVVNLQHWFGKVLLPATPVLISALSLGLLASVFVAELTAFLTLKVSPGAAKIALRVLFLGVFALILFGPDSVSDALSRATTTEALPNLAWKVAIVLVVLNAGLLIALPKGPTSVVDEAKGEE